MDAPKSPIKTVKTGRVVAQSSRKTVKVRVERPIRHPMYNKIVRRGRTFLVHDEAERCKVGDLVRIVETRPLSRLKRWRVLEIVLPPAAAAKGETGGAS